MKRAIRCLAWCAAALLPTGAAQAADIVLELSAVEKLVAQTLFTHNGRHDLMRGPCFAYLEKPAVTLLNGRVKIRSYFNSRLGVAQGNACMGMAFASWTEVSGKPVARGGSVVLGDIRIDKVDDPNARMLVESGLLPALPRVIELDVLKSVRSMLQNAGGQFEANVDAFNIDSVTTTDDRLAVKFDFRLVAR